MEKKLKELRERRGLSQNAVAEFIGVSRQMYSKYESGEVDPSLKAVRLLCKLYDITYEDLLDNKSHDLLNESEELYVSSPSPAYGSTNYLSQMLSLLPNLLYSEKAKLLGSVAQSMANDVEAGRIAQQIHQLNLNIKESSYEEYSSALTRVREISDSNKLSSNGQKWTREELHER